MPEQFSSPNAYVEAMQKQIQGLPTQKDQQEIIAAQKATASALEQLLVFFKAGEADKELIAKLEEYRKQEKLTTDQLLDMQNMLKTASDMQIAQGEQIQKAFDTYVSDSKDEAIQKNIQYMREQNIQLAERLDKMGKSVEESLKQAYFADEDEKRVNEKKQDGIWKKLFGWAEEVVDYLKKFWDRFGPKWEDIFKIAWALFAPQILNAFKWGVEHLSEIAHFKLIVDIATHMKGLKEAGKTIASLFKSSKAGIIALPAKMANMLKESAIIKKLAELPGILKELNVVKKVSQFGKDLIPFIKKTDAFKYLEVAGNWVKTFATAFKDSIKSSKVFNEAMAGFKLYGKQIAQAFKKLQLNIAKVSRFIGNIQLQIHLAIMEVKTAFGNLAKAGEKIAKAIRNNPLIKDMRKLGKYFSELGQVIFQTIMPAVSKTFDRVSKGFKSISRRISAFGKLMDKADKMGKIFGKTGSSISALGAKISPLAHTMAKLSGPARGLIKALKLVGGKLLGPLMIVIDAVVGFLRTETTETGLKGMFDKLRGAIANVINGFVQLVGLVWNLLCDGLSNVPIVGKWLQEHKMTDQGMANFSAHLVGMNAYTADDGKIHYETLAAQDKREYTEVLTGRRKLEDAHEYKSEKGDNGESKVAQFGPKLAQSAASHAYSKSHGKCGRFVGDAVSRVLGEKVARKFRGNGGDWAKNLLKNGKEYFEMLSRPVSGSELEHTKLPPGTILSWPAIGGHRYGHVEIADGHGNLISDFKRPARRIYRDYPNHKAFAFVPKGTGQYVSIGTSPNAGTGSLRSSADDFNLAESDESSDSMSTSEDSLEMSEPYTMGNAIDDIIAAASNASNAESDTIYGRSSSTSASSGSSKSDIHSKNAEEVLARRNQQPAIILEEPIRYDLPYINDISLIQQQVAHPLT